MILLDFMLSDFSKSGREYSHKNRKKRSVSCDYSVNNNNISSFLIS